MGRPTTAAASASRTRFVPAATAVGVAVVLLGPALRPGVVLAYDLAWSPDARLTPFALGIGTPAPRAVPSDAAAVALGLLLGGPVAQKVVLLGILVLAGLGCAALLRHVDRDVGVLGRCAAVVLGEWNAYVGERLVVGQWTVVLGYAVLPWALRAALRARQPRSDSGAGGQPGWALGATCAGWVALAGVGGANTLAVVAGSVLLVLLVPPVRPGRVAAVLVVALGAGAAWALPAARGGTTSSTTGALAFVPAADTPLGVLASLVSGGGLWNPASRPAERDTVLLGAAATVLAVIALGTAAWQTRRRRGGRCLWVPALLGLSLAALSAWSPAQDTWTRLVTDVPGAAVLRDSQKLVAPLVVLTAVGGGLLVESLARQARQARREGALVVAVGLVVLPTVLLPSLAWGNLGRLTAVRVPADYRNGARVLSDLPPGTVGLLPWGQYRRYAWNGSRVSLTLLPRTVGQSVLYDDSLPLQSGAVPGEDPRAARVSRAIAAGSDPVAALRAEGVTYVALERRTGLADVAAVTAAGAVVQDGPDLLVVRLDGAHPPAETASWALRIGWWATICTSVVTAAVALAATGVMRRTRRLTDA